MLFSVFQAAQCILLRCCQVCKLVSHSIQANKQFDYLFILWNTIRYHQLTLTLLKAAWQRTQQLVQQRREAIRRVAEELLTAEDEKIDGTRLVEIIEVISELYIIIRNNKYHYSFIFTPDYSLLLCMLETYFIRHMCIRYVRWGCPSLYLRVLRLQTK